MATNLALDDKLINLALKTGHHHTKKDAVTAALKEYIAHQKQKKALDMFGSMDIDKSFDYKKARKR